MSEVRTAKELVGWTRGGANGPARLRTVEVNPDFEWIWHNTRRLLTPNSFATGCLVRHEAQGVVWYVVVTNAHVVDGQAEVRCQQLVDGELIERRASVVAVDYVHDLAILQEDAPPGTYSDDDDGLELGVCPRPGDSVTICGLPLGCETPRLARGLVSGFANLPIEGRSMTALVVQAPVNSGNSGGPVCVDDGTLAGVVLAINRKLSPRVPRPSAPTARQAVDYVEQALVPVDGFGFVLDPGDIKTMLDSHAYVRGIGINETKYAPPTFPMRRSDFVALQRAVARIGDLPENCSCIGPFNIDRNPGRLLLGWHGQDQRELDVPQAWMDLCAQHPRSC